MRVPQDVGVHRITRSRLGWAAVAFAAYTAGMLCVERGMRRDGGPGIVAFELAGSAARAEEILTLWGAAGRRAARLSLWLDFGYMLSYGALTLLLIESVRGRRGGPIALRLLPIGAVAGDVIEGVALLNVLDHADVDANARRARFAAQAKFVLLAVGLGYVGVGSVQRVSPA